MYKNTLHINYIIFSPLILYEYLTTFFFLQSFTVYIVAHLVKTSFFTDSKTFLFLKINCRM